MVHRSLLPGMLALAAAGLIAGAGSLAAQNLPYTVEVDTQSKTISPAGFAKFDIKITNTADYELDMYVERLESNMPDENWYASFCFNGACYDATVTELPPAKLPPGGLTMLELTVVAGNEVNSTGTVKVLTSNFLRSNSIIKEYSVTVSNGSAVLTEVPGAANALAFPNPASSYTQVAIPEAFKGAHDVAATLFNARGEQVADLSTEALNAVQSGSDGLRVDLTGLTPGAYYYTLSTGSKKAAGSVMVVR